MISTKLYPIRGDYVPGKKVGKKMILLNLIDGNYYITNNVGLKIWKLANGVGSVDDIAQEISKWYEAEKTQVTKDIINFVKKLVAVKLMKIKKTPSKTSINYANTLLITELITENRKSQKDFDKQYYKPELTRLGSLKNDVINTKYRLQLIEKG